MKKSKSQESNEGPEILKRMLEMQHKLDDEDDDDEFIKLHKQYDR